MADPLPPLAVVIPTLDEEHTIPSCLRSIGSLPGVSVVVTDGGSTDDTLGVVARERPDAVVVQGMPGRGGQLRRGVAALTARGYLFVHADCRLPAGWFVAVSDALADPTTSLGCFRLHTEPPPGGSASPLARAWWRLPDLRGRGFGLPYGDQAQFLRRQVLEAIGGFPDVPLMEDLEPPGAVCGTAVWPASHSRSGPRPAGSRDVPSRPECAWRRSHCCIASGVSPVRLARWYAVVR